MKQRFFGQASFGLSGRSSLSLSFAPLSLRLVALSSVSLRLLFIQPENLPSPACGKLERENLLPYRYSAIRKLLSDDQSDYVEKVAVSGISPLSERNLYHLLA